MIRQNANHGILIVEGSSATVVGNKIDMNIKANVALGGALSGKTTIKQNLIEESKSEGIFVVEGEETLTIEQNWVELNMNGIVLVNSKGYIMSNQIS